MSASSPGTGSLDFENRIAELESILFPKQVLSGSIKNLDTGKYYCGGGTTDLPTNNWYFVEVEQLAKESSEKLVKAYKIPGGKLMTMTYVNGTWSDWS